mgnify:CR=1 FL=1
MRAHVRIPATSANLGPGFDALGLALALYNEVEAEEGQGITVRIEGEGADRLPRDGGNVVARGVRLAFETAGRPFKGCALTCVNRIPAARGLGSSAAAWVGGLVAGNALAGGSPSTGRRIWLVSGSTARQGPTAPRCWKHSSAMQSPGAFTSRGNSHLM